MAKPKRRKRRKQPRGIYIVGAGTLSEKRIASCRKELSRCLEKGRTTPGLAIKVCKSRHMKCLAAGIDRLY
jgi:hypothetical protein